MCGLKVKYRGLWGDYSQAVDSSQKSSQGRVVLLYFELCDQICNWIPIKPVETLVGGLGPGSLCVECSSDIRCVCAYV